MDIAIVGFGRMGHMVYSKIASSDDNVSAIIDPFAECDEITGREVCESALSKSDAVIDFSSPSAALDNAKLYAKLGIPAVIGTTGWYRNLDEIKDVVDGKNAKMICSSNFSIGVAMFLSLSRRAGELIDAFDSYDVSITEVHHRGKKDAPSGTALMIAEALLGRIERKNGLQIGNPDGMIDKSLINVSSVRVGDVPGIHTIMIDGADDTIELTHSARSRSGFASGAVNAARWIVKKEKGIYSMDDFINDLTGGEDA